MKQITEKTFLEFNYLEPPAYSPNGRFIAFVANKADYEGNRYQSDLYVVEGGQTRRLSVAGDVPSFCWTPRNTILFPAVREEAHRRRLAQGEVFMPYYEIDPRGGEAVLAFLLPLENPSQLTWIKDELYCVRADYRLKPVADGEERLALHRREAVYETFDELPFFRLNRGIQNGRRDRLYLFDQATGQLTPVSREEEQVTKFCTDGKTILYAGIEYTNTVRDGDVSLSTYEVGTGERKTVMEKGRLILRNCEVYGQLWGDKIIVLGSEGKVNGRTESPAVWLIDRETGEMSLFSTLDYNIGYRNITGDHKLCGGMIKVVGDRVYFTTTIGYNGYVRCFDRAGNWSDPLTPDGSVDSFDVHDGKLCYCGFFDDKMHEIYEDGVQLTHMNDTLLSEYNVVTPEHTTFVASDGVEVDGWVMKPVGYEPGKKYPGILHVHGGPRCAFGTIFFHEHQMWVNDGYFVFFCNPRGSEGKGDGFADIWAKFGTVDFSDLMEFVDHVLESNPDIDAKRVGVLGGSYGGFMTNWIIGNTDRFAAACAQRSISNWITFEYATSQGYTWVPNFHRTRTKDDMAFVWNCSPLKYAHQCKTPTLFIVSDEDHECWMVEGIQMYTGVKMAGVPAKLLMFHDETHELSRSGKPQPRLARMQEIHAWMNQYLK